MIDNTDKPDPKPPVVVDPDPDPDPDPPAPVVETLRAPYSVTVETIRKYWSLDKSDEDLEMSIIVCGSSYFNSNGVSYKTADDKNFDVVASLSGKVKSVTDSPLQGKIVVIEHENKITTEYMSLSEVNVKVGDQVVQGDVIGKAGQNEYDIAAKTHVHFKVMVDGKSRDPELVIGKKLTDIK